MKKTNNTKTKTVSSKAKKVKTKSIAKKKPVKKVTRSKKAKPAKKPAQIKMSKTQKESTMTKGTVQMEKMAEDAANLGRESAEAWMKSGNIFFKGFEEIMRTAATIAQDSAEKQAQFAKEALSTKSLNDWAAMQNKIAQSNFEDFMANATKLTEMSVKVLTESAEPVSEQATKSMHKATKAAA